MHDMQDGVGDDDQRRVDEHGNVEYIHVPQIGSNVYVTKCVIINQAGGGPLPPPPGIPMYLMIYAFQLYGVSFFLPLIFIYFCLKILNFCGVSPIAVQNFVVK